MANQWNTRKMTAGERRRELRNEGFRTLTQNAHTLQGQWARRDRETDTAMQRRVNNAVGRNDVITRDANTARAMLAYARQPGGGTGGNSPV